MLKNISFVAFLKAGGAEWEEEIFTAVPEDATEEEIYDICRADAAIWALKQVSLRIEIDLD